MAQFDSGDIGSRYVGPADANSMTPGQAATLFALLKGILLELQLIRAELTGTDLQRGDASVDDV